jgi:hypothetical protein
MKKAPSMPPCQDIDYESIAICGFIPWRFGSEPGIYKHINEK